eukprot:10459277-Lingulodinium_polyedra.AAC.1
MAANASRSSALGNHSNASKRCNSRNGTVPLAAMAAPALEAVLDRRRAHEDLLRGPPIGAGCTAD